MGLSGKGKDALTERKRRAGPANGHTTYSPKGKARFSLMTGVKVSIVRSKHKTYDCYLNQTRTQAFTIKSFNIYFLVCVILMVFPAGHFPSLFFGIPEAWKVQYAEENNCMGKQNGQCLKTN